MPSISVHSINYDYLPILSNLKKSLWVEVRDTSDLYVGKKVSLVNSGKMMGEYLIGDIIGIRVVLTSLTQYKTDIRTIRYGIEKRDKPPTPGIPKDHKPYGFSIPDTLGDRGLFRIGNFDTSSKLLW